jgi:hypothetical protein
MLGQDFRFRRAWREPVLDWARLVFQVERQLIAIAVVDILHHEDEFIAQCPRS